MVKVSLMGNDSDSDRLRGDSSQEGWHFNVLAPRPSLRKDKLHVEGSKHLHELFKVDQAGVGFDLGDPGLPDADPLAERRLGPAARLPIYRPGQLVLLNLL